MNLVKSYFLGWLSGVITGLILMERWHRKGTVHFLEAEALSEAIELGDEGAVVEVSTDQPRAAAMIVAGAKADARRARELVVRVVPWGSTSAPSVANLRRWGQKPEPEDTSSPYAQA